jgi:hypothetical protein
MSGAKENKKLNINQIQCGGGYPMRKRRYSYNIGVLLDQETYKALVDVTDEQEVTISKYVRDLLKQKFVEEMEK